MTSGRILRAPLQRIVNHTVESRSDSALAKKMAVVTGPIVCAEGSQEPTSDSNAPKEKVMKPKE